MEEAKGEVEEKGAAEGGEGGFFFLFFLLWRVHTKGSF